MNSLLFLLALCASTLAIVGVDVARDEGAWSEQLNAFALRRREYLAGRDALRRKRQALNITQYDVIISEIMYHNNVTVNGQVDTLNSFEFIEFKNVGNTEISLNGWTVGSVGFAFSAGEKLAPGAYYVLARVPSAFMKLYGVPASNKDNYQGSLKNSGERVVLRSGLKPTDPALEQIYDVASCSFDSALPWPEMADNRGFSIVPLDDSAYFDHDDPLNWRASTQKNGSPSRADPAPTVSPLVISEVLAYPDLSQYPNVIGLGDFVEIHNPTTKPVLLDYWSITDRLSNITRYQFPPGTGMLAPGEYRAIGQETLGFGLSLLGDKVFLVSASMIGPTGYAHGISFPASAALKPWGRLINGAQMERIVQLSRPTPNTANAAHEVPTVAIVEINYHPVISATCKAESDCEYVRIQNLQSTPVDLFDSSLPGSPVWRFTGLNITFPPKMTLAPNGSAYIVINNVDIFRRDFKIPLTTPVLQATDGILQNDGEAISLFRPIPFAPSINTSFPQPYALVDRVAFRDIPPWPKAADGQGGVLHRCSATSVGDDATNWNTMTPCEQKTLSATKTTATRKVFTQPAPTMAVMSLPSTLSLPIILGVFGGVLFVVIIVVVAVVVYVKQKSAADDYATALGAVAPPTGAAGAASPVSGYGSAPPMARTTSAYNQPQSFGTPAPNAPYAAQSAYDTPLANSSYDQQAGGYGQPAAGGYGQPAAGGYGQPAAGGYGQAGVF